MVTGCFENKMLIPAKRLCTEKCLSWFWGIYVQWLTSHANT